VIAEVPTGFTVFHVRFTVQLLAPEAIVHVGAEGVSVPDVVGVFATCILCEQV
jgi:hypothetical protein